MPTQPIVEYHPREDSDKLAKSMMMEKLGSSILGASETLNKGIESYQRIKANKQTQDLAAITAAGVMVGGLDKLPIETRNKLPHILGVEFPKDEKGNTILTPSAQDVVNRAIEEAAKRDPVNFGRVKSGMQTAARDPQEVALDAEKEITSRQAKVLEAKHKADELAYNRAKDAEDRAATERNNIRTTDTQREVAQIRGPTSASARAEHLQEKSNYWIDKRPGKTEGHTISKAAAEMTLEPGQKLEDIYWNPSHEELKEHNDGMNARSRSKRAESSTQLDQTRDQLMQAKMKQIGAKDPEGLKFILDGLKEAYEIKKKGGGWFGSGDKDVDATIAYLNGELAKKYGKEAGEDPSQWAWMADPKYAIKAYEYGWAWLEGKAGRGADLNTPAVRVPGKDPPGSKKAVEAPGSPGGEEVTDPELEALLAPHRK